MSQAADKLYITQPTVSKAIAEMETAYGIKLFERLSQRLYITQDGERLLPYARHIVNSFEQMEQVIMQGKGMERIRIGCSVSVGTSMINDVLDLSPELAKCDVNVMVNNTSEIENMILKNEVDIAIVEGIANHPDLIHTKVCKDQLLLVCNRNHALAQKETVRLEDLVHERLISREHGSVERNQFVQFARERGIVLQSSWCCTNTEAIKNAVLAGRGIAILSSVMIRKELKSGELIALPVVEMPIERNVDLIYHKQKFITPAMRYLMDACDKYDCDCQ